MYKIWLNTDENGNIVSAYGGYIDSIGTPLDSYQYEFEVTSGVYKSIGSYRVINGQLILK
jgi:hypothetical protein